MKCYFSSLRLEKKLENGLQKITIKEGVEPKDSSSENGSVASHTNLRKFDGRRCRTTTSLLRVSPSKDQKGKSIKVKQKFKVKLLSRIMLAPLLYID